MCSRINVNNESIRTSHRFDFLDVRLTFAVTKKKKKRRMKAKTKEIVSEQTRTYITETKSKCEMYVYVYLTSTSIHNTRTTVPDSPDSNVEIDPGVEEEESIG